MMSTLQFPTPLPESAELSVDLDFADFLQTLDPLFEVPLSQRSTSSECEVLLAEPPSTDNSHVLTLDVETAINSGATLRSTTAAERTRQLNRQHQKRHRQKKKAKLQQLEAQLKLAQQQLQSRTQSMPVPFEDTLQTGSEPRSIPGQLLWQTPGVLDPVVGELLQTQHTAWGTFLTCPLLPHHDAACQKVGDLPFSDLAALRQGFVTQMGRCLMITGQDADYSSMACLGQLRQMYCCLHTLKARSAPRWWRRLLNGTELWNTAGHMCVETPPEPDWAELTRMMYLTPSQQASMVAARNKYAFSMADIASKRQQLTRHLSAAAADVSDSSADTEVRHAAEADCWQQLQDCAVQENRCLIELYACIGHEVLTPWQSCVAIVHCFPRTPDPIAMADAILAAAGDVMPAADVHSALESFCNPSNIIGPAQIFQAAQQTQARLSQAALPGRQLTAHDVFG